MVELELIEKERTLEEIENFSEQSKIDLSFPCKSNIFLTSLAFGASLVMPNETSAKPFEIKINNNETILVEDYNDSINDDFVEYIDIINKISKRKISKNSLLKNILSFKSLTESWDGYGAIPLEIDSAANSLHLLDLVGENIFCRVTNYFPNPNGTISFEWENKENELVSLEVGNSSFSYFVEMASKEVEFFNNKFINATEAKKLSEFIKAI